MAKKIKIEALLPLLRFGLPQSEGQTVSVEKKQGDEIIEAGYGKLFVASKETASKEISEEETTEEETEESSEQ